MKPTKKINPHSTKTTVLPLKPNGKFSDHIKALHFQKLIEGYLVDEEAARLEDKKRSKVLSIKSEQLRAKLKQSTTPLNLASFRFWQAAKQGLIGRYAPRLSRHSDLVACSVTPKAGGIQAKDTSPRELRDALTTLQKLINGALETDKPYHPPVDDYLGCVELSFSKKGGVQPHAHLLCTRSTVTRLKRELRKLDEGYRVYSPKLRYVHGIPEDCVHTLSYFLKGATWMKDEKVTESKTDRDTEKDAYSNTRRPPIAVERLWLQSMDKLELLDVLLVRNDDALDNVLDEIDHQISRSENTDLENGTANVELEQKTSKTEEETRIHDRIGSFKVYHLNDVTCHNLSQQVTSKNAWGKIANTGYECAVLDPKNGRLDFLVKSPDGTVHHIRSQSLSDPSNLIEHLGKLGLRLWSARDKNKVLKALASLPNVLDVRVIDGAGYRKLSEDDDSQSVMYVMPDGTVVASTAEAAKSIGFYPNENQRFVFEKSGSSDVWNTEIAPLVRSKPVAMSVMGTALTPLLVKIEGSKASLVGTSKLLLFAETSVGKTRVAEVFAMGLFTSPKHVKSARKTIAALTSSFHDFDGTCIVLDELTNLSSDASKRQAEFGDLVHAMDEGNDRERFGENAQPAEPSLFSAILTGNEMGTERGVHSEMVRGGHEVRLHKLDCGDFENMYHGVPNQKAAIKKLEQLALDNHGWIAPLMMAAICDAMSKDRSGLIEEIDGYMDDFEFAANKRFTNMTSAESRIADRFGVQYAALKFAQTRNILPRWAWGSFKEPIIRALEMALDTAKVGVREDENAASKSKLPDAKDIAKLFRKEFQENPGRFVELGKSDYRQMTDREADRAIFVKWNEDSQRFNVFVRKKAAVAKLLGSSERSFLKHLHRIGALLGNNGNKYPRNRRYRLKPAQSEAAPEQAYIFVLDVNPMK